MNKASLKALTLDQLQNYREAGLMEILDLPLGGRVYIITPDFPGMILEMCVESVNLSPFYGSTYSLYSWIDGKKYSIDIKMPRGMVWLTLAQALKAYPDHRLLHFMGRDPSYYLSL